VLVHSVFNVTFKLRTAFSARLGAQADCLWRGNNRVPNPDQMSLAVNGLAQFKILIVAQPTVCQEDGHGFHGQRISPIVPLRST
jgi:hypothetical protein